MTPRERMLTALDRGRPDRVPLDIWATGEVWQKLFAHFGTESVAEVKQWLHVDGFNHVDPVYAGPPIPTYPDGTVENYWGMRFSPQRYATGVYHEQSHCPLAFVQSVADLDRYPWPRADWFDFTTVREQCERQRDLPVMAGSFSPFYFHNLLRGLEQSLVDLAILPELTHVLVERLSDFHYAYCERLFEAAGGLIDITMFADDFGTQTGLMVSQAMVEEFHLPAYRRLSRLCRDHGVRVFHHDDGAIWDLLPGLIDSGVNVLDPVQYRCGPVDLDWLKDTHGGRLAFHGGVDNQEVLAFGTVDDVREEVRKCLRTLGRGGGYILAPCHNLQPVSPVENIVALYETAFEEGVY
ncbi:MAG: uroporphyrinogen-III decarboxylase-like protein [Armatimonadetes bacterium]|nr:uroporphyrinogen-III decarboxylase-like protein [Armatimonadota bacterium]